ncbi:hypothetical protein [Bergeyella cardium]|uniref:Uncharacterized protein n=1 Tax=Bergeyella cardium TaxID=1585976 RepID=A0A6P1QYE4_9FLAO|nr:hypothetical protein [Bergeyella cardium]QHN65730.1 hypothetical protein DBX24_07470 [Bergeyella cardium]WHE33319.1 hypothetical protein P8603_07510 [Bergeyella cardium]WHF59968.1 hypothetical protein O0R51_07505 [Bergeyella cardium]
MRKIILGAIVLGAGLFSNANAQIQKGNLIIGGDIFGANFGLNKGGGYNFNLQPKAAYFVEDNVAVGGYADLGFSGSNGGQTKFTYTVGALGRYYLSPGQGGVDNLLKHGRWFLEANVGVGGESISKGGNSANGLGFGFGPGYSYFLTPNIGLEGVVKYDANAGFGNGGYTHNIKFGLGLNIFISTAKAEEIIKNVK